MLIDLYGARTGIGKLKDLKTWKTVRSSRIECCEDCLVRIDTSTLRVVIIKNEKNDEVQVLRLTISKMGETVKCIFWWSTFRTLKVIIGYIGAKVKTSLKATTKIGAYSNSTNPKGITWKPNRVLLQNFQWTI